MWIGIGHTQGNFVHIEFPQDHRASLSQALHYKCIPGWDVRAPEAGTRSGFDASRFKQVLQGQRNAMQWSAQLALKARTVSLFGLLQRQVGSEGDEGIQAPILRGPNTINDVVLCVVTGALGRFLTSRGVPQHVLRQGPFRIFCPVSTRTPSEQGALGNRVSNILATVPIAQRDAVRRLHEVSRIMAEKKGSHQAMSSRV